MSSVETDQATAIIAKQLFKFRQFSGLSQQQLGDVLGVSNQQYSKFETGKNRISASQILIVVEHFSVDANQFFSDTEFIETISVKK